MGDRLELVVEWEDGGRVSAPFPLPPATPTPCEFVARLGQLATLSPGRWRASWWVQPMASRKPATPPPVAR